MQSRYTVHWGARCLALRTRNSRFFIPRGTLPTHPPDPKSGHVTKTKGVYILANTIPSYTLYHLLLYYLTVHVRGEDTFFKVWGVKAARKLFLHDHTHFYMTTLHSYTTIPLFLSVKNHMVC